MNKKLIQEIIDYIEESEQFYHEEYGKPNTPVEYPDLYYKLKQLLEDHA